MTTKGPWNALLLAMVLTYSIVAICWGVVREPLSPEEARTIFTGREVIMSWGAAGGISTPAIDELIRGNFGSVEIAPAVLAMLDAVGRIYGARLFCGVLCIVLVGLIYLTGNSPMYGWRGLLAACTFVFLGVPLQLSSCATADAFAGLFLGASLWLVEHTAEPSRVSNRKSMLLLGGLSLVLGAMTNYFVVLFLLPLVLFAFLRHRVVDAVIFFALPVFAMLSLYGYFAVFPDWSVLERKLQFHYYRSDFFSAAQFGYVFNWLAMPYLLATVSIFHKEGGKYSFLMMLLSAPALLVPFASANINDMHTVVFMSMILLAPAAALGVAQMADIFSANNSMAFARPFFVTAILLIIWVFGVQQMKELERERPDLSPAVTFLGQQKVAVNTVLVDSDYGSPEYVYHYYLEEKSPPVRVVSIVRAGRKERKDFVARVRPEYVVVDDLHSDRSFNEACRDYLEEGFAVAATYKMSLVSGDNIIRIFKKGAL